MISFNFPDARFRRGTICADLDIDDEGEPKEDEFGSTVIENDEVESGSLFVSL